MKTRNTLLSILLTLSLIFALIAALMGYMAWIIYYDDQRRGRK